jgi:glycosyltransferase involved in cell wall biosynthesis
MTRGARIAVCVPVFRPGDLLADTLSSIQNQSFGSFEALISIDGGDVDSARVCTVFARDPRFSVVVQPRRLGWVGNANALLARVKTEMFCLHPHDDLMHEGYLAALCAHLDRSPHAVTAFADMRMRGERHGSAIDYVVGQSSVMGTPVERLRAVLTSHFDAIAWRGLTRTRALGVIGFMRTNRCDNFAEDTVWMAKLARAGELHRVPEVLYTKRYHTGMTHTRWGQWPLEKRLRAWVVHCSEMWAEAMPVARTFSERAALSAAALKRVLKFGRRFWGNAAR